ncbi:unnamed protein product [Brachionus calyciflorus]|uniref:Uncharacterized protein n=1 Tax=Brachionus calyciflorus TaxID=104777 RepID=A0A813UHY1_9BILA|nr:unnamed protein product [Brachionus calyciflorus]
MNTDRDPKSKPPLPRTFSSNRVNFTVSRSSLNDILNPSRLDSSHNHLEVPDAATSYYTSYTPTSSTTMLSGTMSSSSCSPTPSSRKSNSPTVYRRAKSDKLDKILSKNKQISTGLRPNEVEHHQTPAIPIHNDRSSRSSTLNSGIKNKTGFSSFGSSPTFSNRKQTSVESLISNSFVQLHLQRRLPFTNATPTPYTTATSSTINLKPRLDESKSDLNLNESKLSNDTSRLSDEINNNEYDMEKENNNPSKNSNDSDEETETDLDDSDENVIPIAGTLAQSAESKLSQFITDSTDISRNLLKKHRKQHSMSDESLKNLNLNKTSSGVSTASSSNTTDEPRAIKKTRSSTNTKSFQTQSLSNIAITALNHSVSDNDLDKQLPRQPVQNIDASDLIDIKDDSFISDENLHETNGGDKSLFDMSGCNDYKQLVSKPMYLSILFRYIIGTENESPRNLYFCLFVDDLLISNDKKETILRWAYELYTTFLEHNAPLKIKINEQLCKKMEDLFDRNPIESITLLKTYLEQAKQEASDVVLNQLSRLKDVKQMGLANLFHGNDLKLSINKNDFESMKPIINEGLMSFIATLGNEINKINNEWNGSHDSAHISAMISSFVTFAKKLGLPIKQIGKFDIDKIPTFVSKKIKLKKNSSYSIRGHSLIDCSFLTVRSVCCRCNQPFWGIGHQGLICQKTKCEIKIHRHCVSAAVLNECHGSQKIKTDYKEKLDNIQKMIFGPKKKDEESQSLFYANGENGNGEGASTLPTNFPRNLPVNEAIKKFEMLNAPKPQPVILTSPTAARVNNLNSGSNSPNSNDNRHSSHNNSPDHLNSDPEPEDIKLAISSNPNHFNERFQIDLSNTIDQNSEKSNNTPVTYRISPGIHYQSQTSSTSSTATTNSNGLRQSWMQGSDMEVDEELPSIAANIQKENLEQLTRKEIKTQEVINELIHTEQKHVRNLKIMKHHFYVPIKINVYLTAEERDVLFPNLDEVLEIHANFNKKLKKLRRENPIVPIKQLIDVILDQFKGEQGEKFQSACAKFCENQSQAIKLLQFKLKNSDKFSQFITSAENHSICRKLHLKDFLPTEVQRLVKYRLLFNELSKTASDQDDINRLQECVDASSKISSYVNKAVTECENKIRNEEIGNRIDTKEFDQYCIKIPQLNQYRFLDVRQRKLIYEGELEWKFNNGASSKLLTALLYEDILVLLEKAADEKRRFILKPLNYSQNRTKLTITPVFPLSWIISFNPMNEKRQFHLVVQLMQKDKEIIKEKNYDNRILLIFAAKSGDERNKWCSNLQDLTGKMTQADISSNTLNRQQSSVSSLNHSPSNSNLSQKSVSTLSSSLSSSALNNNLTVPQIPIDINEISQNKNENTTLRNSEFIHTDTNLEELLNENSKNILKLLKERHSILTKMIGIDSSIDDLDENDLNVCIFKLFFSLQTLSSFEK